MRQQVSNLDWIGFIVYKNGMMTDSLPVPSLTGCRFVGPDQLGCGRKVVARGLCIRHYQALRRFSKGKGRDPSLPVEEQEARLQITTRVNDAVLAQLTDVMSARDEAGQRGASAYEIVREVLTVWAAKRAAGLLDKDWPE